MQRFSSFFGFLIVLLLVNANVAAAPVVDVAWLKDNIFSDRLRILDVRSEREYSRVHIAGAVHTRYPYAWRVPGRDRIPRLPSPETFGILAGNLGIGNHHHVVIVSRGEAVGDIAVAAQIYWTFKAMGHDAVSILDGGMKAYLADSSAPRTNGETKRPAQQFKVNFRPRIVANAAHVRALLSHQRGEIIDVRTYGTFVGVNKEYRAIQYGTIPRAKHLSFAWLTYDAGGLLRSPASLKRIVSYLGITLDGPVIVFSDQGLLAALGWFAVSELLRHVDVRVYDAGFRDWALDGDNPIERRLNPERRPMTFTERYAPQETITPDELEGGLKWLVYNGVGAQIMETLAAGAFLTAFALSLGANNLYIGLIAAIPHLANIVQIGGVYMIERYRKRRVLSLIGGALSRIMLLIILAAAFIPHPPTALAVLLIGLLARYGFGALFACCWNAWIRDFVPDERRGTYMGKRLFVMSAFAIPVGLVVAFMIDLWGKFSIGPVQHAYAILFLFAFIAGSYGVFCLSKVPEPRMPEGGGSFNLRAMLARPFAEDNYRRLMIFLAAWHFAINLATPFFAVHMLKRLGLELSLVIVFITLSQIANILVLRQWGAIADRFANKTVLGVCGPLYILCIFMWTFTTFPEKHAFTIPLLIGLHIVMGIATAGVNIASTNIAFKLAPAGEATSFLAANSLVSAAAAGIAPIIGGVFADIFVDYKLSMILQWESPARVLVLQTLKFEHWDFFFLFAVLIGLYAMHRLGLVREEGEVAERVVLTEILQDARRTLRNLSSVPGLRSATEFPFELLRLRRQNRENDQKDDD